MHDPMIGTASNVPYEVCLTEPALNGESMGTA